MRMGIEHYAFVLFVAALICLIAILFKLLFANTRRLKKLLDERESKLLQLYQTVESIMEDFTEQIKVAMEDIKEHENRAAKHMADLMKQAAAKKEAQPEARPQPEKPAKAMTVDSSRIRAASEVLERAERMIKNSPGKKNITAAGGSGTGVIQRLFDDTTGEQQAAEPEKQAVSKRRESILALAEEGKTHAQIARELGITQNEVKLVIGLGFALRQNEK